ncbi:MAG TPA: molybdopterin molybdenumtransferase MoeA [Gammaproteobacteria bacterium]|nr:molybdopterin molybdenumtransferase MoeA [Gammaproteobacteria bacterium]
MSQPASDCCTDPSQKLLSVEQGRQRILDAVSCIGQPEQASLREALDRILAQDVVSNVDVPPFANSAMDGYALRHGDCADGEIELRVMGESFAGHPFAGQLGPGECVRIMTGAPVPPGADSVLMQEQVQREGDRIRFDASRLRAGDNVRHAGEDSRAGQTVLEAGTRLGPAELGLLASVGVAEVSVYRPLRVAFFSTGDELVSLGTPLGPGQIYDSNRYTLHGLLRRAGVELHDLGVIPDTREAVRAAFSQAGAMADLVLTSGGVSVGEADYVTDTLRELGQIDFWRMAMKPGKPLAFGHIGQAVFFGLPGNPVSAMVTFWQFVLPAIRKMGGEKPRPPLVIQARCRDQLRKAPGRMEFQRGILAPDPDGGWSVSTTGLQGSHVMRSMTLANCFILLEAENAGVEAGSIVRVQPFSDF